MCRTDPSTAFCLHRNLHSTYSVLRRGSAETIGVSTSHVELLQAKLPAMEARAAALRKRGDVHASLGAILEMSASAAAATGATRLSLTGTIVVACDHRDWSGTSNAHQVPHAAVTADGTAACNFCSHNKTQHNSIILLLCSHSHQAGNSAGTPWWQVERAKVLWALGQPRLAVRVLDALVDTSAGHKLAGAPRLKLNCLVPCVGNCVPAELTLGFTEDDL